jgi:adenosylcobinamide-GDP ribazoletransferase
MIAAHAASRACAISYLATLDYVRAEGKAKPVAQRLGGAASVCVAVFGLPWLLWPDGPRGLHMLDWRFAGSALAVLLVLRFAMGRYFFRRIGGYTGDCLGFAQQVFELGIYLVGLAWISS